MIERLEALTEDEGEIEARRIFETQIGTSVLTKRSMAGNRPVLKFVVGREAPIYQYALLETKRSVSEHNPFRGTLGLLVQRASRFPDSLEATVLLTLLTRSTRAVVEGEMERGFSVPDVPFQNQEDHKLAQAANHVVVGRRGVGKSTLIRRAVGFLRETGAIMSVVDAQAYPTLIGVELQRQILQDVINALVDDAERISKKFRVGFDTQKLLSISNDLGSDRNVSQLRLYLR